MRYKSLLLSAFVVGMSIAFMGVTEVVAGDDGAAPPAKMAPTLQDQIKAAKLRKVTKNAEGKVTVGPAELSAAQKEAAASANADKANAEAEEHGKKAAEHQAKQKEHEAAAAGHGKAAEAIKPILESLTTLATEKDAKKVGDAINTLIKETKDNEAKGKLAEAQGKAVSLEENFKTIETDKVALKGLLDQASKSLASAKESSGKAAQEAAQAGGKAVAAQVAATVKAKSATKEAKSHADAMKAQSKEAADKRAEGAKAEGTVAEGVESEQSRLDELAGQKATLENKLKRVPKDDPKNKKNEENKATRASLQSQIDAIDDEVAQIKGK